MNALSFLLAVVIVALPLAWLIHVIARELRARRIIKQMRPRDRSLGNMEILPPHKSAARPSNVMALAKRPAQPKEAA